MVGALRRLLLRYRTDDHTELTTPRNESAVFELVYEGLRVGTLRLDRGKWTFEYSREFKDQSQVKPLVAFADLNRRYEANSLWPFFVARIPSTAQPEVRETIDREGLDAHSDVQLLRRFGREAIANPFRLVEAT